MKKFTALALALSAAFALSACGKEDKVEAPAQPETATQTAADAASTVDLSAETQAYKAWVEGQIDELLSQSEKFVALLNEGKLDEAKALYPVARMPYERSEPIAESFGDLDPRIDNREADLQEGEQWTGFHPIEKILWTKNTTEGTKELSEQLIADIKELRAKIPTAQVTGELMVNGAVDLLNEVSTSKITGEEEIFSHTDLYDFYANIEGAHKIFEILQPKLQEKNPELVTELTEKFNTVFELLNAQKQGEGFKSFDKLSKDETKALAEAVNKLGEPLAQMGVVLK